MGVITTLTKSSIGLALTKRIFCPFVLQASFPDGLRSTIAEADLRSISNTLHYHGVTDMLLSTLAFQGLKNCENMHRSYKLIKSLITLNSCRWYESGSSGSDMLGFDGIFSDPTIALSSREYQTHIWALYCPKWMVLSSLITNNWGKLRVRVLYIDWASVSDSIN
jgi:hypothetical protein